MDRRNFIKNTLITAAGAIIAGSVVFSNNKTGGKKMKILVITGSPRKNGNSNTLADNFIKGAQEAGFVGWAYLPNRQFTAYIQIGH